MGEGESRDGGLGGGKRAKIEGREGRSEIARAAGGDAAVQVMAAFCIDDDCSIAAALSSISHRPVGGCLRQRRRRYRQRQVRPSKVSNSIVWRVTVFRQTHSCVRAPRAAAAGQMHGVIFCNDSMVTVVVAARQFSCCRLTTNLITDIKQPLPSLAHAAFYLFISQASITCFLRRS